MTKTFESCIASARLFLTTPIKKPAFAFHDNKQIAVIQGYRD